MFPFLSKMLMFAYINSRNVSFPALLILTKEHKYTLRGSRLYLIEVEFNHSKYIHLFILPPPWKMHCYHQKGRECGNIFCRVFKTSDHRQWFAFCKCDFYEDNLIITT